MGDGSVGSYRWQPDRVITPRQERDYWHSQFLQMKSERDHQVKENIRLAKRVVELERLLVFKRGDEVHSEPR
jgi:hypothetical protein